MWEKIYKAIQKFFLQKQFVFRFDYYDGTEKSLEIYETNVAQYEFINQGTSVCIINGMELMPAQPFTPGITQLQPQRWLCEVNYNEKDVTVYKYKFIQPPCFKVCSGALIMADFQTCINQQPPCEFLVTLFIGGVAITNPFSENCNVGSTAQLWQDAIDNNLLPGFQGTIVVTQSLPTITGEIDLTFTFTNIVLPCNNYNNMLSMQIEIVSGVCEINGAPDSQMICEVPPPLFNKLLVISKEFATVRKTNP